MECHFNPGSRNEGPGPHDDDGSDDDNDGDPGPDDSDPPEEDGGDHKHCPDTPLWVSGQCQISYTVLTASACVRTAK